MNHSAHQPAVKARGKEEHIAEPLHHHGNDRRVCFGGGVNRRGVTETCLRADQVAAKGQRLHHEEQDEASAKAEGRFGEQQRGHDRAGLTARADQVRQSLKARG